MFNHLLCPKPGVWLLLYAVAVPVHAWSGLEPGRWEHHTDDGACRLVHSVPGFGDAVFERTDRRRTELTLHRMTGARSPATGTLFALPPAWRHDRAAEPLGQLWREPSRRPFTVSPDVTDRALLKLSDGMGIAIRFADPDDALSTRLLGLTPIGSESALERFNACVSSLPPLPQVLYDEIQIYFGSGSASLSAQARQRLGDVVNRVRYETDIIRIDVVGHADASGSALRNEALSRQRMLEAVNHLIARGVPPDLITSAYRGEADAGRPQVHDHNRRVAVRFVRADPWHSAGG